MLKALSKTTFVILCTLLLGAESSEAQTLETSGDLSATWSYSQKPSAVRDQPAYRVPIGILGMKWGFEEAMKAVTELSYGRTKDSVTGRAQIQIEKAYLEIGGLTETLSLRFGQIPNSWVELMEQENPFSLFLGTVYQPLVIHWNELNRADSGLALVQKWSSSRLELSFTNGEGSGQDEKGSRKEIQVYYTLIPLEDSAAETRWVLALGLLEGGYDNIEANIAQKERIQAYLKYEKNHGAWSSLELMSSKDPVDGINIKVADQVDLTDLGGLVARGSGGGFEIGSWLGDKTAANIRYEYWNPAQGVDARGLSSRMLGFHFFPRQHLQFSLAWMQVQYEKSHSVLIRDSEEVAFGARLRWP